MLFLVVAEAVDLQVLFRAAHQRVEGVLLCDLHQPPDALLDVLEDGAFGEEVLEDEGGLGGGLVRLVIWLHIIK